MEKKKSRTLKMILAIVILLIGVGIFVEYKEYTRPSTQGNEISVEIKSGMSTKQVGALLKEKGIIHLELPFYLKLYRTHSIGKIRYGIYELNDGMSLNELVDRLTKGGKEGGDGTIVLTIPEGYSIEMIAERLEAEKIMTAEEFLQAVRDKTGDWKYADQLPAADTVNYPLQGYLFPDTYHLTKEDSPEDLVDMFLKEFDQKFDQTRLKRAQELNMSVTEVLTRASMVQKETDKMEEYPIIAGVINNRLAKNMRLQFDSTVVYAISDGKYGVDRVMYSDLECDSPYNTYKINGLPVGPICNPSIEAIDAVLYAKEHNYLFFQIDRQKNDGSNLFFETYEEHLAASSTAKDAEETSQAEEEKTTAVPEETQDKQETESKQEENTSADTE